MEIVWISIAFILGLSAKQVGLPPLVGYLAAGFMLSAFGSESSAMLEQLAHYGVLLLLFCVGLKLHFKSLLRGEVLIGATAHMALSVLLFGGTYLLIGGDPQTALVIGIALAFSSTVVAAKVLEQRKELRAFHGRAAIGILIIQDLVAVAFLSLAGGTTPSPWIVVLLALPLFRIVIQRALDFSGHGELLVLLGLLLALGGGALFGWVGLSSELGALVLGSMLAGHRRASELSNALWGLKEVFLVGFFLQIGMTGLPTLELFFYALLLALLLPLKATLFFVILLLFKLRARTAFLAGLNLATYSEFGLIVALMGNQLGWLSDDWLVLLALAVALSFAIAAPLNRHAHELFQRYASRLEPLQSRQNHPDDEPIHLGSSRILVVGMGRVGTGAYDFFSYRQQRVIGFDSDPGKVDLHRLKGRRVLYADAEDPNLWQNARLQGIIAVLLATPDLDANIAAAKQLRLAGYEGHISATTVFPEEAEAVMGAGANVAYNYYDQIGVGFAEHVWEEALSSSPNPLLSNGDYTSTCTIPGTVYRRRSTDKPADAE